MAWPKNFVFLFDEEGKDSDSRSAAKGVARRFNVPDSNRITYGVAKKGFLDYETGCLSNADKDTKIMFIGHGGKAGFGGYSCSAIGDLIEDSGVKEVGLISFKGCKFGAGNSLISLGNDLISRGINFGYLSAYKEDMWYVGEGRYRGGFFKNCLPGGRFFLEKHNKGKVVRLIAGNLKVDVPGLKHLEVAEDLQDIDAQL